MFGELFKDIKDTVSTMRHGTPTRTIVVAKPYCSPARHIVTGALEPYGVKVYGFREAARMANPLNLLRSGQRMEGDLFFTLPNALPVAQIAEVTVSEAAASWAEYLLLRTAKLYRVGPYINRRNQQWAARHGGQMPPAWDKGQPWIERSCSEGMKAWQEVKQQAKEKGKRR